MMSQVIRQETAVFLLSVAHGALLAFLYDLLRAVRRTFRHGGAAVAAEDFLFWLTAGFLTFCLAFFRTDGVIRGYVAVGIILGAILYHFTLSQVILTVFSWIFRGIRTIISGILTIVGRPFKKICLFLKKRIEFTLKSRYNESKKRVRGSHHGKKKKTQQQ